MKVIVVEWDVDQAPDQWSRLADHVDQTQSELVLLPEFPFSRWFAVSLDFESRVWETAVSEAQQWLARLGELSVPVIGTIPADREGKRRNAAFLYESGEFALWHDKRFLPDEPDFREAHWYERGSGEFSLSQVGDLRLGVQICTELWFTETSRKYGRQGVQAIVTPRATPMTSRERWLVAGRMAAITAGAYSLSSNHSGQQGSLEFAGLGWIIDPDGEIVASTSPAQPFVTANIDLAFADKAKSTYPRYVLQ